MILTSCIILHTHTKPFHHISLNFIIIFIEFFVVGHIHEISIMYNLNLLFRGLIFLFFCIKHSIILYFFPGHHHSRKLLSFRVIERHINSFSHGFIEIFLRYNKNLFKNRPRFFLFVAFLGWLNDKNGFWREKLVIKDHVLGPVEINVTQWTIFDCHVSSK